MVHVLHIKPTRVPMYLL